MISDPSPTPAAGSTGEPVAASGPAPIGTPAGAPSGTVPETSAGILAAAEANLAASRRLGAQRLALAYAWAGAHEKPATAPMRGSTRSTGGLRRLAYRELGATGLPVAEDAPAELGISLAISSTAARNLIGAAIDLVHRLPHTWTAVQQGRLEAWVGQRIARLTADLSDQAAGWVDAELAAHLELPTGRLLSRAEATVLAADRATADAHAEHHRRSHTLHLGRHTEHGTRTLFARCDAADALRFYTIADQLARALQTQTQTSHTGQDTGQHGGQDTETLDQLRARAIGLLANPALALTLLAGITDPDNTQQHQPAPDDTSETGPEPDDTRQDDTRQDDTEPWDDTAATAEPRTSTATESGSVGPPGCPEALLSAGALARLARLLRGHTDLYLHLTPAMLATGPGLSGIGSGGPGLVARAEQIGALTREMLIRLLGHEHVTIKPVINLAEHLTSDRYEVPTAIAERLHLAKPHDVFPYAESLSRRQDQDHSTAWQPDADHDQTHLGNLAHLTRHHHRIKTHAPGWRTWQLDDHTHLWRTPHGRYRLVDQHGTHTIQTTATGPPDNTSPPEARLAALTAAVA